MAVGLVVISVATTLAVTRGDEPRDIPAPYVVQTPTTAVAEPTVIAQRCRINYTLGVADFLVQTMSDGSVRETALPFAGEDPQGLRRLYCTPEELGVYG